MHILRIIFYIIITLIALFACIVSFKYTCIDKHSFLCCLTMESAAVLKEFQTIIAAMIALFIGYLNLRAIQKQTTTSQDLLYAQFTEERRAIINEIHSRISTYITAIKDKLDAPIFRAGYGEGTTYKVTFPERPTILDDDSKFAKLKNQQIETVKGIRTSLTLLSQAVGVGPWHLTQETATILDQRISANIDYIISEMDKLRGSP